MSHKQCKYPNESAPGGNDSLQLRILTSTRNIDNTRIDNNGSGIVCTVIDSESEIKASFSLELAEINERNTSVVLM